MKKLIIYDLDGTLADTRQDIIAGVQHMLKVMELPVVDGALIERYVGRGVHHLIQNSMRTDNPKTVEKGIKIYREHYAAHMMDHTRLYPGALEILNYFKKRKQAVITNKPNPFSKDILSALKVADYFSDIVAGDSEFSKKPDPAAALHIMKREKVSAEEALFIGDSLVDIETARNAGIEIVVLTHGFGSENELKSASPAGVFQGFPQLLEYIKEKNW